MALNPHTPHYLLTLFQDKIQQTAPLVNQLTALIQQDPEDMQAITALAQQLDKLHIQPIP